MNTANTLEMPKLEMPEIESIDIANRNWTYSIETGGILLKMDPKRVYRYIERGLVKCRNHKSRYARKRLRFISFLEIMLVDHLFKYRYNRDMVNRIMNRWRESGYDEEALIPVSRDKFGVYKKRQPVMMAVKLNFTGEREWLEHELENMLRAYIISVYERKKHATFNNREVSPGWIKVFQGDESLHDYAIKIMEGVDIANGNEREVAKLFLWHK